MAKQQNLAGWITELNTGFLHPEPRETPEDKAFVTMKIGTLALHIEKEIKRALNAMPQDDAMKLLLEFPQLPQDFLVTGSLPLTYRQGFHQGVTSMVLLSRLEEHPAAKSVIDEATSIDQATIVAASRFPELEE